MKTESASPSKRAIICRFLLDDEDKKLLSRYAKAGGYNGIRAILRSQGINALIEAKDWERSAKK